MTTEDIAYCAGLFEGEGCVSSSLQFRDAKTGIMKTRETPSIQAVIKMTDYEPLERFYNIFGGQLDGPYTPPSHKSYWKPQWTWRTYDREAIADMMNKFWPYLSPRRREQTVELYHFLGKVG